MDDRFLQMSPGKTNREEELFQYGGEMAVAIVDSIMRELPEGCSLSELGEVVLGIGAMFAHHGPLAFNAAVKAGRGKSVHETFVAQFGGMFRAAIEAHIELWDEGRHEARRRAGLN